MRNWKTVVKMKLTSLEQWQKRHTKNIIIIIIITKCLTHTKSHRNVNLRHMIFAGLLFNNSFTLYSSIKFLYKKTTQRHSLSNSGQKEEFPSVSRKCKQITRIQMKAITAVVLNLWSPDHQWSTAICLVVRKQGLTYIRF